MSIFLPDYSRPPPALLPRSARVRAILGAEVRARSGAINLILLALIHLVVVAPIVVEFYFQGLASGFVNLGPALALFYSPFATGVWSIFLVLLATSVGAATIAGDTASRSITMYLCRPITALDYLGAKLGAVGVWIAFGAVLPGCIGSIIVLALGYVALTVALQALGAFLLAGLLGVFALGGLTILLSALASRTAFAGAGIFGVLIGSEVIATVLSDVSHHASFLYLSPLNDWAASARALFGVAGDPLDPWAAGGALVVLGAVGIVLAYLRLRRTEVVAE